MKINLDQGDMERVSRLVKTWESNEWDRSLAQDYYLPSIRRLNTEDYRKNPGTMPTATRN